MLRNTLGARRSLALLSLAAATVLAASASQAQNSIAERAWQRFNSANNDAWSVEWSEAGDRAVALRGRSRPVAADPVSIAAGFIAGNADLLALPGRMRDLTLVSRRHSTGDTHVTYQQSYGGLPVFNGFIDVHVNRRGQIYLVHNNAVSSAEARSLNLRPALARESAAAFARGRQYRLYDLSGDPYTVPLRLVGQPELGIQQTERGPRLSYRADYGPVTFILDAQNGRVIDTIHHVVSATGVGTIFDPNPVNTLNNTTLEDREDANYRALRGAYFDDIILPGVRKVGAGANAKFLLRGPNVSTFDATIAALGGCMNGNTEVGKPPPESDDAHFDFNRSQSGFEHTMVYFHIDRSQRYIQETLGIDNNFASAIRVDAHAFTKANAFYCDRPVGGGYLAFGDSGDNKVDTAEDADVVLHEYGHALQHNASNGRYSTGGGHARAMGEGFGDYWAYSANTTSAFSPACVHEWFKEGACLRRLDKNKKFPDDFANNVHRDGEIWSQGLRDLHVKIGKEDADKIILKSHFLVPASNLTFSKGLKALIDADENLNLGINKDDICASFLDRGIGAAGCGYWILMSWNNLGADVDLWLNHPSGTNHVGYSNPNPDWGDPESDEDDPLLYGDCITSCTNEKITVDSLPTPGTYKVRAHYFSDRGKGSSTVTIEVLLGSRRQFIGTEVLAATGAEWFPFDIVVEPEGGLRIVEVDRVVQARPGQRPAFKKEE